MSESKKILLNQLIIHSSFMDCYVLKTGTCFEFWFLNRKSKIHLKFHAFLDKIKTLNENFQFKKVKNSRRTLPRNKLFIYLKKKIKIIQWKNEYIKRLIKNKIKI